MPLQNSTVTVSTNNGLLFNTNSGAIATFNVGGLAGSGNISLADGSYALTLSAGGNGAGTTYSGALSGVGRPDQDRQRNPGPLRQQHLHGRHDHRRRHAQARFQPGGAPAANIINNATNASSLALGGGTLAIQGNASTTNSQRFNGLTVNPGCSAIVLTAGTSNPLLLSLGSISRSAGGTVDFTLPSGTQSATNGITTTTPNTNGILGGYATVGGTDWACSTGTARQHHGLQRLHRRRSWHAKFQQHPQRLAFRPAEHRHFRQVVQHAEPDRHRGGHDEPVRAR